ncbi:MAG: 16S rRNA processing protein RimM [Bacteroidetes bacterium GWF2_38_335]|nr:MAG: 16S rRNA processing protein RimM [Bacteroidetes bacterium GWF2_38_335]OFY81075.1 MAG: 16S rRNA processing protein RimM [Bacteroidetes bacterium RIFOXYA12_FULL_38_20]HBS87606.1 16S rRNA processing protein RimM [Bacteroidales bacterium]
MVNDNCLLIGRIAKTYGTDGEFLLKLDKQYSSDDFINEESVFVEIDGRLIPFFIEEISSRNDNSLIIKFDDIVSESRTNLILEKRVFVKYKKVRRERDGLDLFRELTGYEVIDNIHGKLGIIAELLEFNANPVFSIKSGKQEILIPANREFIESVDHKRKSILINSPKGLIDIYLNQ